MFFGCALFIAREGRQPTQQELADECMTVAQQLYERRHGAGSWRGRHQFGTPVRPATQQRRSWFPREAQAQRALQDAQNQGVTLTTGSALVVDIVGDQFDTETEEGRAALGAVRMDNAARVVSGNLPRGYRAAAFQPVEVQRIIQLGAERGGGLPAQLGPTPQSGPHCPAPTR